MWQDRTVRTKFLDLSRELGEMGVWVRMHYVYPYPHVDEVIPLMTEGKILPYLDIPFQHASPAVLKNMRRPAHQEKTSRRIQAWRETCPDLGVPPSSSAIRVKRKKISRCSSIGWMKQDRARRLLQI
ncbi:30S ribosomal protein S12 methylthiotransferase [Brucella vulpis]|nr:30S ribosomal protein S12 methylthiotransferase [Brucella vulpis]CUW51119.1 30S ribosomal protein S12 methylthiotransferase [Brucella vulpis]